MASTTPRVLIAGAGIGGLTLAHALRASGFDVEVFERDHGPTIRSQGYRIHIDETGNAALRACLPKPLWEQLRDSSGKHGDRVDVFDSDLTPRFGTPVSIDPEQISCVDRQTFRTGLLRGLEDLVHFGHEVIGFDEVNDGVRLRCADETTAVGDLLVAADGTNSVLRQQRLPHARVDDTGMRCIYGRVPVTDDNRTEIPPELSNGFSFALGPEGDGMGFAPLYFRTPQAVTDYLMTVYVAHRDQFDGDDETLFALPPEQLWTLVSRATSTWSPAIRRIVAQADPSAAFPISLRSARRIDPWRTTRITLLGDAIHTMLPTAGVGANTALWDAQRLHRALREVVDGRAVLDAVGDYEQDMLTHGFGLVQDSLMRAREMFGWPISVPASVRQ